MPEREHEKQERNGRVNKKPAMQPVLQFNLQIEHAALVAPGLNFFDPIAVRFGDAKFNESKCVFGKTGVAEAKCFAAFGRKIREYLAI